MFIMAPLNIIGELAKVISISFRLFGNIMGGSIIILVVSYLTFNLVTPPFLNAFFGAFVGTIQAFVFTMLTLVYIAVQVA
jgi:F-type H+-transporting ATPase subunit a